MSIKFNSYEFSEPLKLNNFEPVNNPLIFVILIKDKYAFPRPFKPIFWGEAEDLWYIYLQNHQARNKWLSIVDGDESKLYVSLFEMPDSDTIERKYIVEKLIYLYGSEYNN